MGNAESAYSLMQRHALINYVTCKSILGNVDSYRHSSCKDHEKCIVNKVRTCTCRMIPDVRGIPA